MNLFVRHSVFCLLALVPFAVPVMAQTADPAPMVADTVSYGDRVPTLNELRKAFAPSELQSMNIRVTGPIKKSVDMDLTFEFGSAKISPKVKSQLSTVGQYLQTQGANLGENGFRIEGHTDAVGTADANNELSLRRAMAVKDFLVTEYKIDGRILSAAGVGAARLKDERNPASEVNRRVEFSVTIKE